MTTDGELLHRPSVADSGKMAEVELWGDQSDAGWTVMMAEAAPFRVLAVVGSRMTVKIELLHGPSMADSELTAEVEPLRSLWDAG